jgi:predicted alpha/beta-hydrolase family hydrolase
MIKTKVNGAKHPLTFIMAHGAGAPMDSDWMNHFTTKLVKKGIRVVRFEFPYMVERRLNGTKRPPNKSSVLLETWREVLIKEQKKSKTIFIGGKSMGGRMASLIADDQNVNGLIGLGFPFHAPGKDPKDRILHLEKIKTPSLIVQGTRDTLGSLEDCKTYKLSKNISFTWLEDGDHSWKPRVKSGHNLEEHMDKAADEIVSFMYSNS